MNRLESKHPRAIRWMHWLNVPDLCIMIWSGLLIYWANDVYELHLGVFSFHFFRDRFYRVFALNHNLATGMSYHFTFMWFFAILRLVYVLYTCLSRDFP